MYRRTHRALAKAIREAATESAMSEAQVMAITGRIADVCEESTPQTSTFDREVFVALAVQRQLSIPAED